MVLPTLPQTAAWHLVALLVLVGILALIVLIVYVNDAERRIPVQYAKRQVGRKMYGGQSIHLPMKVNMSGVLPIIFAQSIASLPATIWAFHRHSRGGTSWYTPVQRDRHRLLYMICYFLMIIGFSYFYATIQFNPVEISNNLQEATAALSRASVRASPPATSSAKVLNKITLLRRDLPGHRGHRPLIAG